MATTNKNNKILVILGPTATGKSGLAVKFAKKYNGEIISADSRQVYKGLNIGTGKITKKEMRSIPHYMIDVTSYKKIYSVVDWKTQSLKIIKDIQSRGKLPIICGGTGFYIQSIVDGITLPEVPPNKLLRKQLEIKSASELFKMLKKIDPVRARNIDSKNPVRLIRAIEIAKSIGSVPKISKNKVPYEILQIGLTLPQEELKKKIRIRLFARIREGMIEEAKKLHAGGLSFKRMKSLGLEYKYLALYLEKKITKEELVTILEKEIWNYSKRQMTWFKKDKRINWYNPKEQTKIFNKISSFALRSKIR